MFAYSMPSEVLAVLILDCLLIINKKKLDEWYYIVAAILVCHKYL